jgi:NTE family protein
MGVGDEADLASYLLFDGLFCRQLIEMGRADAHARRDEILKFFGDASDDDGGGSDNDDTAERPASLSLRIGT